MYLTSDIQLYYDGIKMFIEHRVFYNPV